MDSMVALLAGIIMGSIVTYFIVSKSENSQIFKEFQLKIDTLNQTHQEAIKEARNRSIDGSRAVIKGKLAEQFAPILPDFKYLPSDAKFIGDPIDYIVFNGYTNIKDNGDVETNLEIVILDIKTGQSLLTPMQQAIASAVNAGRVRFEVVRPEISNLSSLKRESEILPSAILPEKVGSYNVKEIRKTYARAYEPWTKEDDALLVELHCQDMTIHGLAIEFDRNPGAIRSRLSKLGLRSIKYS